MIKNYVLQHIFSAKSPIFLSLHRKQKEKESLGSIIINLFPKRGKRKL